MRCDPAFPARRQQECAGEVGNGGFPKESAPPRGGPPVWIWPAWIWIAGAGGLILVGVVVWLFASSHPSSGNSSVSAPAGTAPYALRSNVTGASLVRLDRLPSVTPEGNDTTSDCSDPLTPATPGGKLAAGLGWKVVQEAKFHGLDVVLVVRGFDQGTSARCFSKDANVAFFDGGRLIGVLFSKGEDGIRIRSLEQVNDHLRVWSWDPVVEGDVNLAGTSLSFDKARGSDAVCAGRYRVPVVFGKPYAEGRRILIAGGWVPKPGTEETTDYDGVAQLRKSFPEADSCAGTGYGECGFTFVARDGVTTLGITTLGGPDDAGVSSYSVDCDGALAKQNARALPPDP